MAENNVVVRVYSPRAGPKAIIRDLQSEFDKNRLSIVGKDYRTENRVISYDDSGDRMKAWSQVGTFWGGLSSLLLGSAFYSIPGIGRVIVFGPLVRWIVTALEGAVTTGGLSAVGSGLHSMGVLKTTSSNTRRHSNPTSSLLSVTARPTTEQKPKSFLNLPAGCNSAPLIEMTCASAREHRASLQTGSQLGERYAQHADHHSPTPVTPNGNRPSSRHI